MVLDVSQNADDCEIVELTNLSPNNVLELVQHCWVPQKIAKTGSICCVAARPHSSSTKNSEGPTSPHEPYWRTNTTFSPPPPRWDSRFHTEASQGIHHGYSNDGIQLFGSTSANDKESKSWMRGVYSRNHPSISEGGALYFSSPSETSLVQPWTPPPKQRIYMDDIKASSKRGAISGPLYFTPTMEGTSMMPPYSGGSTSSRSDSPRNFPSRRSFMSKPVHPLSCPILEPSTSLGPGHLEFDTSTLRDTHRLSNSSSSIDLADISDQLEATYLNSGSNPYKVETCGVCDRLLSQKSPWSSRRIVKSGDMPVTGVLFCSHVFHADCLEQTTPMSHTSDPPCPVCAEVGGEKSPEQCVLSGTRISFPSHRAFCKDGPDGPSKSWGCVQARDCVEGAVHTPRKINMLLLNRNKIKKRSLVNRG